MRGKVIKSAVVYVAGWLSTKLWIGGFHPVALALFMAVWCSRLIRLPLYPILTAGIVVSSGALVGIKYGLVMLTIAVVYTIMEEKRSRVPILKGVLLGGGILTVMEIMDLYMSNRASIDYAMAILSTILSMSLGVVIYKLIEMFQMPQGRVKTKSENGTYKEQLDSYEERMNSVANAFAVMARNMERAAVSDEIPVWELIPTWCETEGKYCEQCQKYKRQMEIYRNKLKESRNVIINQLTEMAKILGRCAENTYDFKVVTDEQRARLISRLGEMGIVLEKVVRLDNRQGVSEIILSIKAKRGKVATVNNISAVVEEIFGKYVEPVKEKSRLIDTQMRTYRFKEKPNYYVLHGIAQSGYEMVSGDNFSCMELDNGQTLLGLSDGMGTGEKADKDSQMVLGLLENLMESGFDEQSALRLINTVFTVGGDEATATVDMGIIDRYSGLCDFVKLGAASTYVKRGQWVESIRSTTLPIGGSEEADVESSTKKLYDGDYIIMMSDGVADVVKADKEDDLSQILLGLSSGKPQEMAKEILAKVKERWPDRNEDDMTVMVTGIWNYGKCS